MVSTIVPGANLPRIDFIVSILGNNANEAANAVVNGSPMSTKVAPAEKELLPRVEFINSLCALFDDNYSVVGPIAKDPEVSSLRDVALNYTEDALAKILKAPSADLKEVLTSKLSGLRLKEICSYEPGDTFGPVCDSQKFEHEALPLPTFCRPSTHGPKR